VTQYSINDLRSDFQNLYRLTRSSPLYVEIETVTRTVHRKMRERLTYDVTDFDDALQRAMICLTTPISTTSDVSPLQFYLEIEYEKRKLLGEDLLITEFRRILYSIIRNELRKVHTKGYVEALVDRAVSILTGHPDVVVVQKSKQFRTVRAPSDVQRPTPNEIIAVANTCSSIPKIPQTSPTRNSPVYSPPNLKIIVETFISSINQFQKDDLFELFSHLLTSWTPSILSVTDETTSKDSENASSSAPADADIGADEFAYQNANRIWSELSENQRRFMHANTWNVQQEEIARRVQFVDRRNPNVTRTYSRPSIVNLQQETLERLKAALSPFERDEQIEIIRILNDIATNYQF